MVSAISNPALRQESHDSADILTGREIIWVLHGCPGKKKKLQVLDDSMAVRQGGKQAAGLQSLETHSLQ